MPVRTAGALVFLLLMIEQHNTFSFWNGYQINPMICQNILYSHCFMSQNTCFSFLNSGTAHHFLFLPKEQHTTFSFCQNHGWSILNQSFARFMMGSNYVDPKTVLDNVKSTTWKFFKFRMEGGEVDKNYVFCRLCLDGGNEGKRGQIKYCGGTTNMTNHLKACHKEEAKSLVKEEGPKQSILHHFVATTDKKVKKWPKSTEKWKELTLALAKWFCTSSRSTAMVDDVGFHAFLSLKMDLRISGFIFLRFEFIIHGKLPFEYTYGFLERIND